MERFEHILVCVKRPAEDRWLLQYTGEWARSTGCRGIHLLHICPADTTDESAGMTPAEAEAIRAMRAAANAFRSQGFGVTCGTAAGSPMMEILRHAMETSTDLIVLGRTSEGDGSAATTARRIAMKATCSVLVVPQDAEFRAKRILVPVRNSVCSARAVEAASAVAAASGGAITCLNVFPIRGEYLEADLTLEEHAALMQRWAQRENEQLLSGVDTGAVEVSSQCLPDLQLRPAGAILKVANEQSVDLIVIGARGRTGAAGVLLGAVTEQLIRLSPVPILAVKKKGECLGILRALLTLAG